MEEFQTNFFITTKLDYIALINKDTNHHRNITDGRNYKLQHYFIFDGKKIKLKGITGYSIVETRKSMIRMVASASDLNGLDLRLRL